MSSESVFRLKFHDDLRMARINYSVIQSVRSKCDLAWLVLNSDFSLVSPPPIITKCWCDAICKVSGDCCANICGICGYQCGGGDDGGGDDDIVVQPPSEVPTIAATDAPTPKPTPEATEPPTNSPTNKPTPAPTEAPTAEPTTTPEPTQAPTAAPVTAAPI